MIAYSTYERPYYHYSRCTCGTCNGRGWVYDNASTSSGWDHNPGYWVDPSWPKEPLSMLQIQERYWRRLHETFGKPLVPKKLILPTALVRVTSYKPKSRSTLYHKSGFITRRTRLRLKSGKERCFR